MADAESGLENGGSKKAKQKRPDGLDVDRYKNINDWEYREWAWEFLRRNSEYIMECGKVVSGTEAEKQAVAQNFGLKKFKNYSESYKGKSGYPIFSMGSISSWSNLDRDKDKSRRVPIRVGAGQIVIRFDLASAINDVKSLEKQLRLAERRLNKRLAAYEEIIQEDAKVHKHQAISGSDGAVGGQAIYEDVFKPHGRIPKNC